MSTEPKESPNGAQQSIRLSGSEPAESVTVELVDGPIPIVDPQLTWIERGGTVVWENNTETDHELLTYQERQPANTERWKGKAIEPGASLGLTLDDPGVYDYYCRPHSETMVGTVVVGNPDPDPDPGTEPGLSSPPRDLPDRTKNVLADIGDRTEALLTDCDCPE